MAGTASAWVGVMVFMAWSANEEAAYKGREFQTAINGATIYREAIKSASPQDFTSSPQKVIQALGELREATYAQYLKPPLATSFWIPPDNVYDAVQTMYQGELGRFGLPMLADKQKKVPQYEVCKPGCIDIGGWNLVICPRPFDFDFRMTD